MVPGDRDHALQLGKILAFRLQSGIVVIQLNSDQLPGADVNGFFGIMTMIIAVPTGVKVFNWMFTMYGGRVVFAPWRCRRW